MQYNFEYQIELPHFLFSLARYFSQLIVFWAEKSDLKNHLQNGNVRDRLKSGDI